MLEAFGTVGGENRVVNEAMHPALFKAMGGTVDWGHGADCDGGGSWELAMDGLWGAVGAWW